MLPMLQLKLPEPEAAVYVPEEFSALQDSLNAVMAAITAKESKLFKNFGVETEKLAQVATLASTVSANAATKKEEVKAEAANLLTSIKAVIEENAKLIPKLPRGKEGAEVIEQIKADVATVDAAVVEAQGLFDNGSFMDAMNKIKAAKEKADGLNAGLGSSDKGRINSNIVFIDYKNPRVMPGFFLHHFNI